MPNTNLYCEIQGTYAGLCTCPTKVCFCFQNWHDFKHYLKKKKTYWDGAKCATVATVNGPCTYSQQCDTSVGLTCITTGISSNTCGCQTNEYASISVVLLNIFLLLFFIYSYWTGTLCSSKLLVDGVCTSNKTCGKIYVFLKIKNFKQFSIKDDTLLLYCLSNKCQCPSTHYWDTYSLSCLPKKVVSGSCTSSITCDASANLICSGSASTVGSCACPTTSFWNGTACQPKLLWKVSCDSSIRTLVTQWFDCLETLFFFLLRMQ